MSNELNVARKESIYRLLQKNTLEAQKARLHQGILLVSIHQEDIWKGRASSFEEFLEAEQIGTAQARKLMTIARKFFYELEIDDWQFEQLTHASITTLEAAAQVANKSNLAIVLGIVSSLSERDALQSLEELGREGDWGNSYPSSNRLTVALNAYRSLSYEERLAFHDHSRKRKTA